MLAAMHHLLLTLSCCLLLCSTVQAASSHIDLPTPFDVVMLAGSDFNFPLKATNATGAAIDITGYSYRAQFRSAPAPGGVLFANYSTAVLNGPAGLFQISLSKFKTLALSGKAGVWDLLQVDPTGKVTYQMSGKAAVKPTATRLP
jgi:hypothetical protein